MLHIITPLFRFELLEKVYQSIPKDDDILWHIGKSNKREDLTYDFLYKNDKIKLYNIDCYDYNTTEKRNQIFNSITDGYFCLLDDDTTFHENMYKLYKEKSNINFDGMVVGQQLKKGNNIRLTAQIPKIYKIDTGNVFSHHSCLRTVSWPHYNVQGRDGIFWSKVYEFYNKKCELLNEPISNYNFLKK